MIYMIGLRIFAISMRSAILSILFILSRTEYSTDVLAGRAELRDDVAEARKGHRATLTAVGNELRQHRDPMTTPDHLWVHRHGEHTTVHVGVHPVKLRGPDLQYLARSGRAVAIGVEIELEVDPVVELKRNRQLPELRRTAADQRLLLRDTITDAGTIGAEVVGHQARVIAEVVRFQQGEGGP